MKEYIFLLILLIIKNGHSDLLSIGRTTSDPSGKDLTNKVFQSGKEIDFFPAAYGDFNGDKLTDIVGIDKSRTTVSVYLASKEAPYMRSGPYWNFTEKGEKNFQKINSVTMGDFTGDGLRDLMITSTYNHVSESLNRYILYCKNETGKLIEVYQKQNIFCTVVTFCFGNGKSFNCSHPEKDNNLQCLVQEPMAIDLNGDMVLDLLGEYYEQTKLENETISYNHTCEYTVQIIPKVKAVWLSENGIFSLTKAFKGNNPHFPFAHPSSNAFVDVDGDSIPELAILTSDKKSENFETFVCEVYNVYSDSEFSKINITLKNSYNVTKKQVHVLGQPLFIDFERNGKLTHFIPFCSNEECSGEFGLFASDNNNKGTFKKMLLGPITFGEEVWRFVSPLKVAEILECRNITHPNCTITGHPADQDSIENFYRRSLTISAGDYNLDGYPDLLLVMETSHTDKDHKRSKAVIFKNVPCIGTDLVQCQFSRSFQPDFEFLGKYENVTSASFFDLKENGINDVLIVERTKMGKREEEKAYAIRAFETSSNADSYFIKVMVVSGRPCPKCKETVSYGNLITGAQIMYKMKDVNGQTQTSIASQMYRSGYTTLDTPYTIFGIGHSPNFVDHLIVSLGYRFEQENQKVFSHDSHQLIPNSQIIVIPSYPITENHSWTVKLFLTPSDAVLQTFSVLIAIITIFGVLAFGLEYKERMEDKKERMAEARRFLM